MKQFLVIFLLGISLSAAYNNNYSQNSSAANLMPLQIGNTWVYRCEANGMACHCTAKYKYKITSSVSHNGKTYFVFESSWVNLYCTQNYCSGPNFFYYTMRVDTVTGNIYAYSDTGCSNSPFEIMIDSLNASLDDTVWNNCRSSQYRYVCDDTFSFNIFGVNRKSRAFHESQFETGYGRKFSEGIGVVTGGQGSIVCGNSSVLLGCVINGIAYGDTTMPVGIIQISSEVPQNFSLFQNYPNPFNPTTQIEFQIPNSGFVRLTIFDALGREVETLVDQELSPGTYKVDFNGSSLSSGIY